MSAKGWGDACKKQLLCNNVHIEGHDKAKRAT